MEWKRQSGRHAEDETLRLVQDHAAELLRFARRFSICADDAHDAYQRGIEILLRRMRTDPPEHPLNWLRTVIRREASGVRIEREQLLGREEVDLDRQEARHLEDPSERVAGHERLGQVAEALQRLKTQEVTALVLRAQGLSYQEISTQTGWTYTKTNRCITEGRRALRDRLQDIDSGAECERWLPQISLLADGEATARHLAELRPHLRSCASCRATLRHFHAAPRQVAALVPVALVPAAADHGTTIGYLEALVHSLVERATFTATRLQGALDSLPGTKVAAAAASTAVLAGGGVAIEQAARIDRPVPAVAAHAVSSVDPLRMQALVAPAIRPPSGEPATKSEREGPARTPEFDAEARIAPRGEFSVAAPAPPARAASSSTPSAASPVAPQPTAGASPTSSPPDGEPLSEFGGP